MDFIVIGLLIALEAEYQQYIATFYAQGYDAYGKPVSRAGWVHFNKKRFGRL